jgi:branched-chain amino acid transport system substrate-binding protein
VRAALALAILALLAGQAAAATPRGACVKPRVGFLGPLTGSAAFLGKEQVVAARAAVREHGGGAVRLVEVDTQLDAKRAAAAARALRANPQVLAVVGPAGSQEVLAAAPVFSRGERLAFVSASALDGSLTNGSIPSFFRVVPSDRAQAPSVVRLLRSTLKARRVVVVDDGTTYSRRLAERVRSGLGDGAVTRLTADASRTRFAALVARIPAATDAVFLPWHVAATAQLFAQEVRRQRPRAAIVGGDALDSRDFTVAGAYVTTFARDFGPPAATAAEVAARAVRAACADGTATRREVLERIRATDLPRTEERGRLRFTRHGDLRGAAYTVLRLA